MDLYAMVRKCPTWAKTRIKLRRTTHRSSCSQRPDPWSQSPSTFLACFSKLDVEMSTYLSFVAVIYDRSTKLTKRHHSETLRPARYLGTSRTSAYQTMEHRKIFMRTTVSASPRISFKVCVQYWTWIIKPQQRITHKPTVKWSDTTERWMLLSRLTLTITLGWDLYTPALTYAYTFQPHSSISLAPFESVLSRPPPPLALQSQPFTWIPAVESRDKWRRWLAETISEAKRELE